MLDIVVVTTITASVSPLMLELLILYNMREEAKRSRGWHFILTSMVHAQVQLSRIS